MKIMRKTLLSTVAIMLLSQSLMANNTAKQNYTDTSKPIQNETGLNPKDLALIALQYLVIDVAKDVLAGYLQDVYGEAWASMVNEKSPKHLEELAKKINNDLKEISVNGERISMYEFKKRYK
jgi:hypothetical protein